MSQGALDIISTGHSANGFKEKQLGKATAGLQGQSGRDDPGSGASVRTWGFVVWLTPLKSHEEW